MVVFFMLVWLPSAAADIGSITVLATLKASHLFDWLFIVRLFSSVGETTWYRLLLLIPS